MVVGERRNRRDRPFVAGMHALNTDRIRPCEPRSGRVGPKGRIVRDVGWCRLVPPRAGWRTSRQTEAGRGLSFAFIRLRGATSVSIRAGACADPAQRGRDATPSWDAHVRRHRTSHGPVGAGPIRPTTAVDTYGSPVRTREAMERTGRSWQVAGHQRGYPGRPDAGPGLEVIATLGKPHISSLAGRRSCVAISRAVCR
jgi:hypothetical protein